MKRYTREQMATRVARDIPEGAYVNLGIGLPTMVANFLPKEREIFLHSENGLLGMGPAPSPGNEDPELINAGKQPVTLLAGGAFFHHADSFAMMRGGHLDYCVLGAFQVSAAGDLANWHTGAPDAIPAVGGAMDLAIGAKNVFVMMEHLTKGGDSKIVAECSYPVTGLACVTRIYTDLAVIDIRPEGLQVREIVDGLPFEELQRLTGVPLAPPA
jgi:3-oxoadipate CoA-transferase beta subunit